MDQNGKTNKNKEAKQHRNMKKKQNKINCCLEYHAVVQILAIEKSNVNIKFFQETTGKASLSRRNLIKTAYTNLCKSDIKNI